MQSLCTLRNHRRQWLRNTRYQADATPYLGRTFTGWITPAFGWRTHSITSSARARRLSGIVRSSAFAVLRLIVSSYLVGACTGRSAGLPPRRTWSLRRNSWVRPVGYVFLVADCALRSACSAHAIHAAAISINIALSFSDTPCAKRRHSAAYCRKRSASLSITRFTFLDVPMFQVANREL